MSSNKNTFITPLIICYIEITALQTLCVFAQNVVYSVYVSIQNYDSTFGISYKILII